MNEAERLQHEGMAQAERNAKKAWVDAVQEAILYVATQMDFFTMEHVRYECEQRNVGEPHHPNAWGPMLTTAESAEHCEQTDRTMKSTRPLRRAAILRIWKSKLRGTP